MELQELADILREAHDTAPEGETVARVILFGVKYAVELRTYSPGRVARAAGVPTYHSEINKGRNLARYVELKPQENPAQENGANIAEERVRVQAELVGIPIDAADRPEVANRFGSLMQELAQLQELDLEGIEPVTIFPDPDGDDG